MRTRGTSPAASGPRPSQPRYRAEQPGRASRRPAEARGVDERRSRKRAQATAMPARAEPEMTGASGQQQRREPAQAGAARTRAGGGQRVEKPTAPRVDHSQRYPDPGQVAERGGSGPGAKPAVSAKASSGGPMRARQAGQRPEGCRTGRASAAVQDLTRARRATAPVGPAGRSAGQRSPGAGSSRARSRRARPPRRAAARPVSSPATTAAATVAPSAAFTAALAHGCPGSLA